MILFVKNQINLKVWNNKQINIIIQKLIEIKEIIFNNYIKANEIQTIESLGFYTPVSVNDKFYQVFF